jgi:hypothetical protein
MARNTKLSDSAANSEANALASLLDGGYLRIYDGTQPADANTSVTTQNKLAELRFGSPAFGAAVGGLLTSNAITSDPDAAATGDASWFRCFESDGTTVVLDGSVGVGGCNLNLNSVSIQQHGLISISGFTHRVTE